MFDKVFGHNVAKTLEMDDLWKNRQRPRPLFIDQVGIRDPDQQAWLLLKLEKTCPALELTILF